MIEKFKVGEYGLENETEGMYARTDNGIIGKIINSNSDEIINGPELLVNNKIYCVERDSIREIKESVIDLLEVGDYINGERILDITGDYIHTNETNHNKFYLGKNIKTILSKEQYQSNCYAVYTVERRWKNERL